MALCSLGRSSAHGRPSSRQLNSEPSSATATVKRGQQAVQDVNVRSRLPVEPRSWVTTEAARRTMREKLLARHLPGGRHPLRLAPSGPPASQAVRATPWKSVYGRRRLSQKLGRRADWLLLLAWMFREWQATDPALRPLVSEVAAQRRERHASRSDSRRGRLSGDAFLGA